MPDPERVYALEVLDTRSGQRVVWEYTQPVIDRIKSREFVHWDVLPSADPSPSKESPSA